MARVCLKASDLTRWGKPAHTIVACSDLSECRLLSHLARRSDRWIRNEGERATSSTFHRSDLSDRAKPDIGESEPGSICFLFC